MANEFKIKNGLVSDGNIVVTGSITATGGINISGSIASAETASFAPSYTLSSSFNSYTSSASSSVGSLSSSIATTTSGLSSSIGSLSGSVATTTSGLASRIGSVETKTGSYATTGSNIFVGSQVITGSLYITNDMVVQGCSCLQNITASAVSIGTNVVMLNTATPAVRFAGISVQDSGSNAGVTGSIFWDGLCNKWIYSNPSTVGYSGGMLISGPRNTGTIGNESPLTCNYIAKSGGGDHIYDSCIIDDGTTICVKGNFVGTVNITANGRVYGTTTGLNSDFNSGGLIAYSCGSNLKYTQIGFDCIGNYGWIQSLYQGTSYNNLILNASGGNVGIGATSPVTKLEICAVDDSGTRTCPYNVLTITTGHGGAPYSYFGGSILFKNQSYITGIVCTSRIRSTIWDGGASEGGGFIFETTPTPGGAMYPTLTLHHKNRVGIGTTDPTAHLHICNSCLITNVSIENVNCAGYALYQAKSACTAYTWQWGSWNDGTYRVGQSGVGDYMTITTCGKVGILATDPKWLLEICCNSSSGGAGGYPAVTINNPNVAGYSAYYFYKGGSQMGGMEVSNSTCNVLINSLSTINFQINNSNKLTITSDTACFSSSPSNIMGMGTKVHEGTYFVYTGPSCVLTLPINYGSASSIYLFGSLFGNDSMHYAHMMYYYRNDYAGFQGSVINQMSCYNVSTAGQRYTFSVVDPGGLGKSGCQLQINITCAAGPGVGAGSYCTKFKIVVYNVY